MSATLKPVGVTGLEPAASASRTLRATNCATPRKSAAKLHNIYQFSKKCAKYFDKLAKIKKIF